MKLILKGTAGIALLVANLSITSCSSGNRFRSDERGTNTSADVEEEPQPEPVAEEVPVPEPEPRADIVTPPPSPSPAPLPPEDEGLFKLCESSEADKFQAELYQLEVETSSVPDFDELTSLKTICLSQLDIADRSFLEGFPGVDNLIEWFGLNINFKLSVETAGFYSFALTADDGAILSIDDLEVVNNDGRHPAQTKDGRVFLAAGDHRVNIHYYQGPRDRIALELKWQIPGSSELTYIPLELVSRP